MYVEQVSLCRAPTFLVKVNIFFTSTGKGHINSSSQENQIKRSKKYFKKQIKKYFHKKEESSDIDFFWILENEIKCLHAFIISSIKYFFSSAQIPLCHLVLLTAYADQLTGFNQIAL